MAGRTSQGLSEEQVRQIAAELENGGRPRVALRESSSDLPAGTVGTVVRVGDPAEADEFIVVRINNDELPFTPAELEPAPPRGRRARADVPGGEVDASTRPAARAEGGRRSAARRQVAKLLVQLQYDERGWTVEVTRGARVVLKATPVRPAAAVRMAQFLENEQIHQALAEIVQAERAEAERKAAELRSQLAEIEAVLAGYDEV